MKIKFLILLVLMPILVACDHSTDPAIVEATQAQLSPTVSSYKDMAFTPISNPSSIVTPIGASDPVYDFGESGKSYYKAVELPRAAESYIFEVVSYTTHPGRGYGFRIFLPSFIFLDETKTPCDVPSWREPIYTNGDQAFIQRYVQFRIDPNSKARYVIIHTTRDAQLNGVMATYGSPSVAYAAGMFIPVGGQQAALRGTPDGQIAINIKGLSEDAISGDN